MRYTWLCILLFISMITLILTFLLLDKKEGVSGRQLDELEKIIFSNGTIDSLYSEVNDKSIEILQQHISVRDIHDLEYEGTIIEGLQPVCKVTNIQKANNFSEFNYPLIYINLDSSVDRNKNILAELDRFGYRGSISRLSAISRPSNGALGCFISHILCLCHGLSYNDHLIVLEDDFAFNVSQEQVINNIYNTEFITKGRWDVIVFGQYTSKWQPMSGNVYRLFQSTTTSGYMVNKNYIRTLATRWIRKLRPLLPIFDSKIPSHHLDQIQVQFQSRDIWIGFHESIGKQTEGVSTIGNVMIENTWSCSEDGTKWYDGNKKEYPLELLPKFISQKIAICHVATGKYKKFVQNVQLQFWYKFLKPHIIDFFLFSDDDDNELPKKVETSFVYKYNVKRLGFPGDTLYRYHYMMKAKEKLSKYDYIFYSDVDYAIVSPPKSSLFMVTGLVATQHLHNITEVRNGNHIGSPETDPQSTACIRDHEYMKAYYAGGVQGGSSKIFIEACEKMIKQIDEDDKNRIMAKWHDESHWNRYLLYHPPSSELSQEYIYPEFCIGYPDFCSVNRNICEKLHELHFRPIMVPLDKNHSEIRS